MMREIMQICAGASSLCQIVERALVILIKTAPGSVTPGGHYQSDLPILPTINLTNHQSYQPSILPTLPTLPTKSIFNHTNYINNICNNEIQNNEQSLFISVDNSEMLHQTIGMLINNYMHTEEIEYRCEKQDCCGQNAS